MKAIRGFSPRSWTRPLLPLVLGLLAASLMPACARRALSIETAEPYGEIWVDGTPTGTTYYFDSSPSEGRRRIEWVHHGRVISARILELDPPVLWQFPLDLIFETFVPIPWAWDVHVVIASPPARESSRPTNLYHHVFGQLYADLVAEARREGLQRSALEREHRMAREPVASR